MHGQREDWCFNRRSGWNWWTLGLPCRESRRRYGCPFVERSLSCDLGSDARAVLVLHGVVRRPADGVLWFVDKSTSSVGERRGERRCYGRNPNDLRSRATPARRCRLVLENSLHQRQQVVHPVHRAVVCDVLGASGFSGGLARNFVVATIGLDRRCVERRGRSLATHRACGGR